MKSIGGYFEWEEPAGKRGVYHQGVLQINSGRNCLKLVIQDYKPRKVYLPKYTCGVIGEAVDAGKIEIEYYSINDCFEPELGNDFRLGHSELLLYTNYFGVSSKNVEYLAHRYQRNLIVDNVHAFFLKPLENLATFYSPRKFFGVPDGGLLNYKLKGHYSYDTDASIDRVSHLLKRLEFDAGYGYDDFIRNEEDLAGRDIKLMSKVTSMIMAGIDYEMTLRRRTENYSILHESLSSINMLRWLPDKAEAPLCYPLLVQKGKLLREYMIKRRIFIPVYWSDLLSQTNLSEFEVFLRDNIVCLPLDQRYGADEMLHVINTVSEFGKH